MDIFLDMNHLNLNAATKHAFARRKTVAKARHAHRARHLPGYDLADRINHETDNIGASLWTYDLNGNRTSSQPGSSTYAYTYPGSSNRLQSVAGPVSKTYTYDAAGNPLSDGTTAFTFNAAGRLSKVVRSGQTNQYYHNALGERVIKSGAYLVNGPYRFMYDSQGKLIGEYDKNNALRQETVWLDDTPVAVLKKNAQGQYQTYYVHADHVNTPRAILDSQNRIVWKWSSNAFGQGLPEEDPDGDGTAFEYHPRFPGQYWDKETGLHYNYYRSTYDPMLGRYGEADPIGIEGGLNIYGYANHNPLMFTDPAGEFAIAPLIIPALEGIASAGARQAAVNAARAAAVRSVARKAVTACEVDPPCSPSEGTLCYLGPHIPALGDETHHPYTGWHYHLYEMQRDRSTKQCFWRRVAHKKGGTKGEVPAGLQYCQTYPSFVKQKPTAY